MLARFLQNKLKLMFWHRLNHDTNAVFGAQLNLPQLINQLRDLVQPDSALTNEICVAILDDNARPVIISRSNFHTQWKRPFVATEIGEALPHWEIAAYIVDPSRLTQAVCTESIILGLIIAVMVFAISVGGWLFVRDLNRQLALARQKTDFVSNVSHELKTPLTSIRICSSELRLRKSRRRPRQTTRLPAHHHLRNRPPHTPHQQRPRFLPPRTRRKEI